MDVRLAAHEKAKEARLKAHAPYSKFYVGAVVKAQGSSELYSGCNVENISYGASICAERVALYNMISNIGKKDLEFMMIVADCKEQIVPCGICLQVYSEFCSPDFPIYIANLEGIQKKHAIERLTSLRF